MTDRIKYKIGYSEDGGIFVGKNIQSDFHTHQYIAIVISFENSFQITDVHNHVQSYEIAYIPKDIYYKMSTSKNDYTVFIHLDPYSEPGLTLSQRFNGVLAATRTEFANTIDDIKKWFEGASDSPQVIQRLLKEIADQFLNMGSITKEIDSRVLECIRFVKKSEIETVSLKRGHSMSVYHPAGYITYLNSKQG